MSRPGSMDKAADRMAMADTPDNRLTEAFLALVKDGLIKPPAAIKRPEDDGQQEAA